VVAKLRQADETLAKGTPIAEVTRSLGVSEVTLHRWRAEYGAVDRDAVLLRHGRHCPHVSQMSVSGNRAPTQ
jgi:hypothetical protein